MLRTSTQVPFLTRDELCRVFGLARDQVRVVAKRVGGGFGGKQEMLTEDIVALAVLRTGRPVQLELTREEEFTATTTRHPMEVTVTLGAAADGTLTGLALDVTADTGAYGNHGPGVLFHAIEEAVTVYRCREQAGRRPRRLHQHGPGRGVPRLRALPDDLRGRVRDRRAGPLARHRPGRVPPPQPHPRGRRAGQRQRRGGRRLHRQRSACFDCLDLVEKALADGRGEAAPDGWATGTGIAVAMLDTIPPGGHHGRSRVAERPDGGTPRSSGRPSSETGRPPCTGSSSPTCSAATPADVLIFSSDTDRSGTTPARTARPGSRWRAPRRMRAARALADAIAARAASGEAAGGKLLEAEGFCDGRSRSVSFTVQGFRVAVCAATGEIRVLQSVQAVDAGTVLNPVQLRGQVEGGVAQALGAALFE